MKSLSKIIFTTTSDPAIDRRMQRICLALYNQGYQVRWIGVDRNTLNRNGPEAPYNIKKLNMWFRKGPLFYLEYHIRVFIFLLFIKSDIISAVDVDTLTAVALVARLTKKPYAFDAHEWFEEVPELTGQPIKKIIWKHLAKWGVKKASVCYTVGAGLAQELEKAYLVPFEVVRNIPDWSSYLVQYQEVDSGPFRILYVGQVNKGRGVKEVVHAIHQLPFCTLTVVGKGDEYKEIEQLVLSFNLENRVFLKGYIEPNKLPEVISNYHLGINLLDDSSLSYKYSMANKFFDYVQMGVPVLGVQLPEYMRLNKKYKVAWLIPKNSIEYIVSALKNLYENQELLIELHANCLQAREEWRWEKEKEKLITIYSRHFGVL